MKTQNAPACSNTRFRPATVSSIILQLSQLKTRLILHLGLVCLALLAGTGISRAANGTWTNDGSGNWSATTNWLAGVVADGTDATADFSTIDITADRTVTLDSARNIGNLIFGDINGAQNYFLGSTGTNGLTLSVSAGTPTITVSTNTANINLPLGGSSGLAKAGNGTLLLGGTNTVDTYAGATTVSAGTLKLTNNSSASAPMVYLSFDDVAGGIVVNHGAGGSIMDGILTGTNVSIVPGGRYGNCLNITGSSLAGGYCFINNVTVPLNNTTVGGWTVAMWMKSTTQGGVLLYQGSGGWVSGNTQFHLVGTNNNTAGSFFGGVRNSQGWESGSTNPVTDGNWHFVAMTTAPGNVKTIYVDGIPDPFPNVAGQNSWNNTIAGNQVWIGGTPDGGDLNAPLNGMIDEVYIYNRALGQAELQTLMNTSNTPASSVLPLTTTVSVASGATLDLNGNNSPNIASLNGTGTINNSIAGATVLSLNGNSDSVFSGNITNTAGSIQIQKTGTGTLTLSGATNTFTGGVILNQGTANFTGSFNLGAGAINLNPAPGQTATANISAPVMTLANGNTMRAGSVAGGTGIINITAGIISGGNSAIDAGTAGFGVINVSGTASVTPGQFLVSGITTAGAAGIWNISGGSVQTIGGNGGTIGATAGTIGVVNVFGTGVYNSSVGGGNSGIFSGENGQGTLNVWGNGSMTLGGASGDAGLRIGVNNGSAGIVNLGAAVIAGGTINATRVQHSGNGTGFLNFHGGLLKSAATPNVAFLTGLSGAFVYGEGARIDDNGQTLNIGQQLLAPSGFGVTSIPIISGGAGYAEGPLVSISGGSAAVGAGAVALAQVDKSVGGGTSGQITNILIINPGSGYVNSDVLIVTLTGGGGTGAVLGNPALSANVSGGLIKLGAGTVNLTGGFTFTGPSFVNAGTLNVSTIAAPVGGSFTVSNATLNVDSSGGGSTLNLGGLTLISNGIINITAGTVTANPGFPAITVAGGVTLIGSNTINLGGFGYQIGTLTLIKYSGSPLASLTGISLGTLPPGLVGTLVNNTSNDSIDVHITGTGQNLSWYGLTPGGTTSSNWDIATTFDWATTGTTNLTDYQEYTTTSTEGDVVAFDDTVFNNSGNPVTTINVPGTVRPFQFLVNNNAFQYTIAGSGGVAGITALVKSNAGTLTLLTSNSYTGGNFLNGGTVIITNNAALGASNSQITLNSATLEINGGVTNSRPLSVPANSIIDVGNATASFAGPITGAGNLDKTDIGKFTIAGTNTLTGALSVSQGTLASTGTNTLPAVVSVGDTGGLSAVLSINGGTFLANNNASQFTSGLISGSAAGAAGDIQLTGGTLNVLQQFGLGNSQGSYGGFNMTGGSLFASSFIVVGFANDIGIFNQSGGTTIISNNLMTIGAGTTTSAGVANISGGTFTSTNGTTGNNTTRGGIFVGETGGGTLNVSGSAVINALGQANITIGRTGAGSSGAVNLNGGTINTLQVSRGAGSAGFSFNGGTLKATGANASFMTGLTYANVYANGAVVDDGGFAVTIAQPLLAPTGMSVGSITLATPGSGYIDVPLITLLGGTGSNAMATATVNAALGTVTGIVVTSPGTGYTVGDQLSVIITGGGGSGASANIPVLVAASTTGGLTKKGAGNLTLTGANTFSGPITNSAGTLTLNSASTYSGGATINAGSLFVSTAAQISGNITVSNGATFGVTQVGTNTETVGNLTLGVATTNGAVLSLAYANGNTANALLNIGTLTLNGSNSVALAGRFTIGVVPLVKYTGAIAGSGVFTNLIVPQGVVATLSNNAASSTLFAVITSTGPGLVWTGSNATPALSNIWDLNSSSNWLLGAVATTYQETIPPGDLVTFNDLGSGKVILNTNVNPTSILVSNNAVSYTFQGSGHIGGTTGLQKTGSNSLTLNLTNNTYTGDNVISNGTVTLGAAGSLSTGSPNLTINSSGLLELAGFSVTANAFNGSGTIDNNSATTSPTLTVGNNNGGGTWSGTITNNTQTALGSSLTKIGTNNLIISGADYINSANPSQVNNGSLLITNGGLISSATAEFWIASTPGSVASVTVDGGTLAVSNNWLVVGRNSLSAVGTLTLNHGTIIKAGANNIVIGSLGASGSLIVNGGTVLNSGMLWLGEGTSSNATLQLNGGLVQAAQVRVNVNGGTPITSQAFFNGGTLQATGNSTDFIQGPTVALVQHGGLILDDGGFAISVTTQDITEDPNSTGGGLTKIGSGTFYSDRFLLISGTTTINAGTLAGIGTINGPVVVGANGTIGAGDAGNVGILNINGKPLTLHGNASMRINKVGPGSFTSDEITGMSTVNYGGTLTVTNASSVALEAGDQFTLFSGGAPSGNFTSILGSPGAGLAYSFAPSTGILSVITGSSTASNPTNITAVLTGNQLKLTWPSDHLGWFLQSQTNTLSVGLTSGASAWHDIAGSDSVTQEIIPVDSTKPTVFFRLRHP